MVRQTALFAHGQPKQDSGSSTFVSNMKLPVHGWFRFSAGFSAEWVVRVITDARQSRTKLSVLDPFAGVGTALLAAEEASVEGIGIDAQPFIARIAAAKLLWHTSVTEFMDKAKEVIARAREGHGGVPDYPRLIRKCFPTEVLVKLHNLRQAWEQSADGAPPSELVWLALTAVLRCCAPVGTAPWQYILPNKETKSVPPLRAFQIQVARMASDMRRRQAAGVEPKGRMVLGDARDCRAVDVGSVDLVVTSPPYANNYDYADATRFEMSFFGEVESWADLHAAARSGLVRSCTQHVCHDKVALRDLLDELSDTPIAGGVQQVCDELAQVRLGKGGRKKYDLMVAAYFEDMRRVWQALRRVCKPDALVCFVVGDSAPYGVYVPVQHWLGELALHAGFSAYRFEKIRDRNVKWKNRKHRVPLCEGNLWVDG